MLAPMVVLRHGRLLRLLLERGLRLLMLLWFCTRLERWQAQRLVKLWLGGRRPAVRTEPD